MAAEKQHDDLEQRTLAAEAALEEALADRNRLWEELNRQKADTRGVGAFPRPLRAARELGLLEGHVASANGEVVRPRAPAPSTALPLQPTAFLMSDVVTVAVPVLNGARYLDEVLTAVRSQRVDREVEILVVDSGSTDGSAEIARKHDARVHEIPKSEFSHGGTRNLMMELARGDYVAFLTQDATPAHDRWLAALLEGFEQADDVAAVWGPHDARPSASHMIKAEMERHFSQWGGGREIDVQRLERSPTGLAAYRAEPWRLTFFSSVNCCLSKEAWQRVPFRDVPYAEDQLIARELIEAGYAKVFQSRGSCPAFARVPASCASSAGTSTSFAGSARCSGTDEPGGVRHTVRSWRSLTAADRKWLAANAAFVGRA